MREVVIFTFDELAGEVKRRAALEVCKALMDREPAQVVIDTAFERGPELVDDHEFLADYSTSHGFEFTDRGSLYPDHIVTDET